MHTSTPHALAFQPLPDGRGPLDPGSVPLPQRHRPPLVLVRPQHAHMWRLVEVDFVGHQTVHCYECECGAADFS